MPDHPHRRRFLQATAATAAAATVPTPALARADDPPPAAPTAVQALGDLVRARFGQHLNAEQLKRAQSEVNELVRVAEALRRINLEHAEEPALVFVADPEE
jgi:TAT (twin-arginine translocation) pathway signal sequence